MIYGHLVVGGHGFGHRVEATEAFAVAFCDFYRRPVSPSLLIKANVLEAGDGSRLRIGGAVLEAGNGNRLRRVGLPLGLEEAVVTAVPAPCGYLAQTDATADVPAFVAHVAEDEVVVFGALGLAAVEALCVLLVLGLLLVLGIFLILGLLLRI